MRHYPSVLLLSLLFACAGKGDDTGASAEGADGSDGNTEPLPDLKEGLDLSGCTDYEGTEIPGAVSYFYGEYTDQGDGTWTGEEEWLLTANPRWIELGGGDCVITWVSTAVEGDAGSCGACDLGLSVSASIDMTRTTCPEDLYKGEENFEVGYGVVRQEGGGALWYYAASGSDLGTGAHVSGAAAFITDKACKWF
jgi:hypothetical protein